MTKDRMFGSRAEDFLRTHATAAVNDMEKHCVESSSAGDLSGTIIRHLFGSTIGVPSWTEGECKEFILALSGLTGNGNWSWLGNSSELRMPEGFERLIAYLGFRCSEDEPLERQATSTAIKLVPRKDVGGLIENLFSVGRNEVFEDGMESSFTKELVSLVEKYGEIAILEIARIITSERAEAYVAAEALKWIGRIKDKGTHSFRRWLLVRGLTSSSPLVREGAGLGLSFINDSAAITSLKQAVEREQIVELRDDLNQVLQQLEHAH